MEKAIGTIELALILVLPLILFYQRMARAPGSWVPFVAMQYLLWFFSYALLHEMCHVLGSWITGAKIIEYQLIPEYWKGDFTHAFVKSEFTTSLQLLISPASPYLRDLVFIFIGFLLFRSRQITGSFMDGFWLVLFVLSPVYDVFNNYFAFVLGARNDFSAIARMAGAPLTHAFGWFVLLLGILILGNLFAGIKNRRIFER